MTGAWAVVENGVVKEAYDARRFVPWWSFTKTILAAAALVLVRDGLVPLDEPLDDKPYTLRHLLQHRSGLVDYDGFRAYHEAVARGDDPWPVPELLRRLDADPLPYATGEGWEYSNIGYLAVRRLIETLTGDTLDAALRRLVLEPLGIENARIALDRPDLEGLEMGSAQAYHPAWVYHGLMVGPVEEAAMLLDRLIGGELLPSDSLSEMTTPFALPGPVPGRPWVVPGYGLGMMTGEVTGGRRIAGHTGGGPGSTIGVYRIMDRAPARTVAYFATDEDPGKTENKTLGFLTSAES